MDAKVAAQSPHMHLSGKTESGGCSTELSAGETGVVCAWETASNVGEDGYVFGVVEKEEEDAEWDDVPISCALSGGKMGACWW